MRMCEFCKGVGDEFIDGDGWLWHVCPKCGGDGIVPEPGQKATLSQIQKWLRHKRMSTTEKYLHTLEPAQAAANG